MKYILLALMVSTANAGPYIGGAAGYSAIHFPGEKGCEACSSNGGTYDKHQRSVVYIGFAGYEAKYWAVEAGAGQLSQYHCRNSNSQHDIQQDINTEMRYLRALGFVPLTENLKAFVSLGQARVTMKNHEFGWNDPATKNYVEHVNYDTRTKPLYGLGITYSANEHVSIRTEITHIRHIAVSHWTGEQNVTTLWLGMIAKF